MATVNGKIIPDGELMKSVEVYRTMRNWGFSKDCAGIYAENIEFNEMQKGFIKRINDLEATVAKQNNVIEFLKKDRMVINDCNNCKRATRLRSLNMKQLTKLKSLQKQIATFFEREYFAETD